MDILATLNTYGGELIELRDRNRKLGRLRRKPVDNNNKVNSEMAFWKIIAGSLVP